MHMPEGFTMATDLFFWKTEFSDQGKHNTAVHMAIYMATIHISRNRLLPRFVNKAIGYDLSVYETSSKQTSHACHIFLRYQLLNFPSDFIALFFVVSTICKKLPLKHLYSWRIEDKQHVCELKFMCKLIINLKRFSNLWGRLAKACEDKGANIHPWDLLSLPHLHNEIQSCVLHIGFIL